MVRCAFRLVGASGGARRRQAFRSTAGGGIERHHLVQRICRMSAHGVQHVGHCAGNIEKADPALHEGIDCDLVRGVEDRRRATTGTQRLTGQTQCREALRVRCHEVEPGEAGKIEPRRLRRHALRPGQRMRDRDAHVGRPKLREHTAIAVEHQTVDHRLRMHQHIDLRLLQREKARRLDQFKALVHQCCRIDADLRAHRPDRVFARHVRRGGGHIVE
jgi:hypothetical protein